MKALKKGLSFYLLTPTQEFLDNKNNIFRENHNEGHVIEFMIFQIVIKFTLKLAEFQAKNARKLSVF